MRTPFGERAFAVLLFQDLSIIPLITVIAALSRNPAAAEGPPGWLLALYSLAAVRRADRRRALPLRPLFALIGRLGERRDVRRRRAVHRARAAALMEALGLSPALGAFVAGGDARRQPLSHELEADVESRSADLLGRFSSRWG